MGTRETVPRTCDQTINDRVQIDFCVSHKNSPEQDGFGESGAGATTFGYGVGSRESTEREREGERESKKKMEAAGWREKGNIDPMEVPNPDGFFRWGVVPLPLATAPTGSVAGQSPK